MAKNPAVTTPKCTLRWAYLHKPDSYGNKEKYKIDMVFEDTEEPPKYSVKGGPMNWPALKEIIDDYIEKQFDADHDKLEDNLAKTAKKAKAREAIEEHSKMYPYREELDDETGEPTGMIILRATQNAEIRFRNGDTRKVNPITVLDAKLNKITEDLGNGSTGRVRFGVRGFFYAKDTKSGVTLDLQKVQVIDLVARGGADNGDDGFEEEEGYVSEGTKDHDFTVDAEEVEEL